MLVLVLLAAATTIIFDYVLFHGDYIMGPVTGQQGIEAFDLVSSLFTGSEGLYMTFIAMCMMVGVVGIAFKFVKG